MIEARGLDIVVVDKVKKETMIIDQGIKEFVITNEKRLRNTAC